ncbi:MAG: chemotaxis-specific protein-glutamate methyltransferase CheB [Erythrobacter sp.]
MRPNAAPVAAPPAADAPERAAGVLRGGRPGDAAHPVRVMIVDDSLTTRTILKRIVESDLALTVTATASSAESALAQLAHTPADVILLDLEMPGMGGLQALPAIQAMAPQVQVLVVSALTEKGAEASIAALAMGAADTMLKPHPGGFTDDYRAALIARITALGARNRQPAEPAKAASAALGPAALQGICGTARHAEVLAIGASTGGIHALGLMLGRLSARMIVPILITQHLPPSFMPVFARQIAAACGRPALLASEGQVIRPGQIIIASGEGHLVVRRSGKNLVVQVSHEPAASGCRPSVDPMLESLSHACGNKVLAVILSGMGRDGLAGAQHVAAAGGTIFAQDAASSAVWGMPGVVTRAGLASLVAPPEQLGDAVMACAAAAALS